MHAPTPREGGNDPRQMPPDFQVRTSDDEVLNALVVEDSPQIAERLVELVSVPNRVEVVSTAATEDEALNACDRHTIALAIVDLQLAQGTGFGVIRRLRAATGANPATVYRIERVVEVAAISPIASNVVGGWGTSNVRARSAQPRGRPP